MVRNNMMKRILDGLTKDQAAAVRSDKRRLLVVAGAGSGKTEVMARRIAWWVGVERVPKENIVAFTFTEKAAEEMKFRIRYWIGEVTPPGEDVNLGGMYVGTIHGFCLVKLREYWPDIYHNYDILDEAARYALILRGFNNILGMNGLRHALGERVSQSETVVKFTLAYDQLHEHNRFYVEIPEGVPPYRLGSEEREWCKNARLIADVGDDETAQAFAKAAARYYAYLQCRRFLDFSTCQTEFLRNLTTDLERRRLLAEQKVHLVVDEVQDINPVQRDIMNDLVGDSGKLTAVGDHRQAIYGFRGAKVEIIGELWNEFNQAPDAQVIELKENFRSTPRIIQIANKWSDSITSVGGMKNPHMLHARTERKDEDPSHIALVGFKNRDEEASWIAQTIRVIVPSEAEGARHDKRDGTYRGLALSDIAVLVRSSTDVRTYMRALEDSGIHAVVRAGPDLFSQPEVLLVIAALAISAGIDRFYGSPRNPKSLVSRIKNVLGCDPEPEIVLRESARLLRRSGLPLNREIEDRLAFAAHSLKARIIDGRTLEVDDVSSLRTRGLREFLSRKSELRRVFPQQIYHWLLTETEVEKWDTGEGRGEAAMFHLGALSSLITGIETPGWTSTKDYKWQIIGLYQYGAESGRTPEQPLIVPPNAVTISTIHSAKGLEFAAVFLADVCRLRFPNKLARHPVKVPISGSISSKIDIAGLSDNENYDGERRLMYVALTRAERFLIISHSGKGKSLFVKELESIVREAGGTVTTDAGDLLNRIRHAPLEHKREVQLSTSFTDMRYYLACSHDFYLRKVLGFAPTIDQAFGYGRGVHNLLRVVHSNAKYWADLAKDPDKLKAELEKLINSGLFYLRYTTGEPAENMRRKAVRIVTDYVRHFADELRGLTFEPEKEFETLVKFEDSSEGGALVSGAIDIVRRDDPPRVTLIDFKSGDPESDSHQELDEEEMKLQLGVYAVAAKKELQYEPDKGLVRYLDVDHSNGEKHELVIPLDKDSIENAKRKVIETATAIRDRRFISGPNKRGASGEIRCGFCDFLGICGMGSAVKFKEDNRGRF
ncbi:MAG: ATP-dependent DNA helicase [Limnochordia bacterium]|jgi:DNA helicase-2/ATP-dependent DNA helicase PcrA